MEPRSIARMPGVPFCNNAASISHTINVPRS
jgi:hypothetical protein